jgi:osmotically-inducible protein OsmY
VRVKLLGEVDMQEDQYESASCAVKVVGLGRVISG